MSSNKLRQIRQQAYVKQHHRCFYCDFPMWDRDGETFSRVHAIPLRFAKYLQCTAEHLVPRQNNGLDAANNIVAACSWCNRMRHQGRKHRVPAADRYKSQVSRLVSNNQWHPVAASKRMLPSKCKRPHWMATPKEAQI